MRSNRLTLTQKKGLAGLLFLTPWLIGFLILFAIPMFDSFRYSLNKVQVNPSGYTLESAGWANYGKALLSHGQYNRTLAESVLGMVVNVPLIVIFSLFSASLLNQKFLGRSAARVIFFLPVIIASGVIGFIVSGDAMQQMLGATAESGSEGVNFLKSLELEQMLLKSGVHPAIVDYMTQAVNRIYEIISSSGVQILIFLAGLQSISPSLYEASKLEGATAYESFWKITFPMVSPLILTNVIYTIIDSFTDNRMTALIQDTAFKSLDFGLSAAMSWIYFAAIAVILAVLGGLISRKVFYYD